MSLTDQVNVKIALNFRGRLHWLYHTWLLALASCALISGCAELQWTKTGAGPEPTQYVQEEPLLVSNPTLAQPSEVELRIA